MALTSARFKNSNRLQAAARNANAMYWGERGEAVALVQKAYVDLGFSMPGSTQPAGTMDGIFGKETYAVTRSFQSKQGLGVDGVIGKQTLHELDRLHQAAPPPGPTPPGPTPVPPKPTPPPPPKPPPPPPTNAKFEASRPLNGFDHTVNPPWQMVPKGGTKIVRLMGGDTLTVVPLNPVVCTVHETEKCFTHGGREFVVRGIMEGKTQICAFHGALIPCRLDVEVKKELVVTMAFHYVSDSAGHKTTRTPAGLPALFNYARTVLSDQINVTIKNMKVHPSTKIDEDLGDRVIWAHGEWDKVVTKRDRSVDCNVFFVWEYETQATARDTAEAGALKGDILMEDNIGYANHGWTLAHEIGHYLGHGGHTARGLDLMMSPSRTNNRINKAMATKMNP
jgi:peptidoglycan hydrolase-like protein with peptidoglycan-binding domain